MTYPEAHSWLDVANLLPIVCAQFRSRRTYLSLEHSVG